MQTRRIVKRPRPRRRTTILPDLRTPRAAAALLTGAGRPGDLASLLLQSSPLIPAWGVHQGDRATGPEDESACGDLEVVGSHHVLAFATGDNSPHRHASSVSVRRPAWCEIRKEEARSKPAPSGLIAPALRP